MCRGAYPKETSDDAKNKSRSKNRLPGKLWFSGDISPRGKSPPFPNHFSKFKIRRHPSSIPVVSKSSEIASDLGSDQFFGHISSVGAIFPHFLLHFSFCFPLGLFCFRLFSIFFVQPTTKGEVECLTFFRL